MNEKLAGLVGGMLNDYVSGASDLAAGQAGAPATAAALPGGDTVPSTNEVMLQRRMADALKPVYQMASQAKEQEAARIREAMFGIKPGETKANPIARGVSDFLANRLYNRDIQPYVKAMEQEALQGMRDTSAGQAGYQDQWKQMAASLISHPDSEVNAYGKIMHQLLNTTNPRKQEELRAAAQAFKNRWTKDKREDKLALLHQLEALQSTRGKGDDFSSVQRRAVQSMRKYLDSLNFRVGDDNKIRGYKLYPVNDQQMRDALTEAELVKLK